MSKKQGLLIAPEIPADTFWSYKHIVKHVGAKAVFPPLGLLTFAAYMPRDEWDFELIDLSVNIPSEDLLHQKIKAAAAVFTGAMNIQRQSLVALLKGPAMGTDTPWVLGGPMASTYRDTILTPQTKEDRILHDGLDFLVWGEVAPWIEGLCAALDQYPAHRQITPELFIPQRVLDEPSGSRKYLRDPSIFKPLENVPIPRWDLLDPNDYRSMMIQTTAGCRFRCSFCDIVQFNGGFARAKDQAAVERELQAIYDTGFRGGVFTVDDNFVSEPEAMEYILEGMTQFQRTHNYPFSFFTQASIDLGKEGLAHLVPLMQVAGFTSVFLGIENPDPDSLKQMNKVQNIKTDPKATVRLLQQYGIEVFAGFIFGTDADSLKTADLIVDFVEDNAILSAMTGKLTPMPHTPLYMDLQAAGRLHTQGQASNNLDDAVEYQPTMGIEELQTGYRHILTTLFNRDTLYKRTKAMLNRLDLHICSHRRTELKVGLRSIFQQGLLGAQGLFDREYFKLLLYAHRLDRTKLKAALEKIKDLDAFGALIAATAKKGQLALDKAQIELLSQLHENAYQALVRHSPDQPLEDIRRLMGEVPQSIERGWMDSKSALAFQQGALDYFRDKQRMLQFPGSSFIKAIELGLMGKHYSTVVDNVLNQQGADRSGKTFKEFHLHSVESR